MTKRVLDIIFKKKNHASVKKLIETEFHFDFCNAANCLSRMRFSAQLFKYLPVSECIQRPKL